MKRYNFTRKQPARDRARGTVCGTEHCHAAPQPGALTLARRTAADMVEVLRVAAGVPPLFEHSDGLQLYDGRLVPWGCSVSRNGRAFNVEDERVLDWLATGGSQELAQ